MAPDMRKRCAQLFNECRDHKFWKAVRCELLCGLVYVLFGCGTFVYVDIPKPPPNGTARHHVVFTASQTLVIPAAFGLSSAILAWCLGAISGAVCNPAITLSLLVTRNISVVRACCYIVVQVLGAIGGAGILFALSSAEHVDSGHLGALSPHPALTSAQGFGVEFKAALLVAMATLAAPDDARALYVGSSVTAAHLFAVRRP
jgi:glycerol uptake facilitator-like aquaporin